MLEQIKKEVASIAAFLSKEQIDETTSFALQLVENEEYIISEAVLIAVECTLDCINS